MVSFPVRRPRVDYRRALAELMLAPGPFLNCYLDVTPGPPRETAGQRLGDFIDRCATEVGDALSEAHRATAESALHNLTDSDALLVALVDHGGLAIVVTYPDPPAHDLMELAALPRVGPLLVAEQGLVHHLIAIIENDSLTIATVPRHGDTVDVTYKATDRHAIAPMVQHASRESNTKLVILCAPGDEIDDLQGQLRQGLDIATALATISIDGLDDNALATEIVVHTASHAAARTVELLRLWRFHHTHGEAVDGIADTLAAIASGRAALVLVHDEPTDARTAQFAAQAAVVTYPPQPESSRPDGRLVDAVIRAAIASDVPTHLVPNVEATLTDGIGAILNNHADPDGLANLLEQ